MTTALFINAFFTGSLVFGLTAALCTLARARSPRAASFVALAGFFLAAALPLLLTTANPRGALDPNLEYVPTITTDRRSPGLLTIWIVGAVILISREIVGLRRLNRPAGTARGRDRNH